jgi:hypothetical protein
MARRQSEVRRRFSIAIPRLRVRLLSDLHLHIHFRTCRHSGFESESCSALYGTQTGIKSKQEKNIVYSSLHRLHSMQQDWKLLRLRPRLRRPLSLSVFSVLFPGPAVSTLEFFQGRLNKIRLDSVVTFCSYYIYVCVGIYCDIIRMQHKNC